MEKMLNNIDVLTAGQKELLTELLRLKNINVNKLMEQQKQEDIILPAEKKNSYKMSSAQKRIYVLEQMEGAGISYNMPAYLELAPEIDLKKLEAVFRTLIKRHEALRTYFIEEDGEFVQKIVEEAEFYLEQIVTEDENVVSTVKNLIHPFELEKPPLLRASVVSSKERNILVFDMHHIISDGITISIITNEMSKLYWGEKLEDQEIHYKDFSEWQLKDTYVKRMKKMEKFWLDQYEGEIPVLALAADYQRPAVRSYEGTTLSFTIEKGMAAEINELALKTQSTNYIVLLAAFNILLSKYTAQEDIIIGCPVAGRVHPKLRQVAGMFVNTLAIRNYPSWDNTIKDFIGDVKVRILKAFDHQEYPFEQLVDKLKVRHDISRNPLFDVVFVMQATGNNSVKMDENLFKPFHIKNTISKFDLTFNLREGSGDLILDIEYCTKLFKESTILRLAESYKNVIKAMLKNVDGKIGDIEVISEKEKEFIFSNYIKNSYEYPREKTIISLFEEAVQKYPDRIAVVYETEALTYRELNSKVNHLAEKLRKKGIKAKKIVSVIAERSIEVIVGMLGVLKAGGAYLPIDADYPAERIRFMIEDSKSDLVLAERLKEEQSVPAHVPILYYSDLGETAEEEIFTVSDPCDPAYIIYTSGTTGKPKGVVITHRNVVRLLYHDKNNFNFGEHDVWTLFHSISFDFSVWEIYGALLYGGKLVVVPKQIARDPSDFLELLQQHKVTVLNQTPTAFSGLITEAIQEKADLDLKYVIFGGEALRPSTLREWKMNYPDTKLINMYGITETTVHVTYKEIGDKEIYSGKSNIGTALPTLSVYIMDKNMKLQPIGVLGEICVGGEGVSNGYLYREELTRERFVNNPYLSGERLYRSGDLAILLENGEFEYIGRNDHQVKIRGHRIELAEIDIQLMKIPQIQKAVTIIKEDDSSIKSLCSYLVLRETLSIEEIRKVLIQVMPEYMIPSYFMIVDKIPVTSNGKTDIKALADFDVSISSEVDYIAPKTEAEHIIKEVWEKELKIENISVNENYFGIGGDSIKAIRVLNSINKKLGCSLKIKDIYKSQTIRELAEAAAITGSVSDMEQVKAGLKHIDKFKADLLETESEYKLLPDDWEDFYPLSQIQKGMVFYSKLKPDEPIYHDQFVFHVNFPEFTLDKFMNTLCVLAARHPILRTVFLSESVDEPIQVVLKRSNPQLHYKDLRNKSDAIMKQNIEDYIQSDLNMGFSFERELLWRMGLFRINEEGFYIVLSFQHAILDGWSVSVLNKDFISIYLGINSEKQLELPELKSSYKDYVAYSLSSEMKEEVKSFWMKTLKDYIPNKLPFNYTGTAISAEKGSLIVRRELENDLLERLRDYAKNCGYSVKELCLSAYIYLLKILCDEKDIVTGLVTHDRPAIEDSEKILGCFLNTIPIRITFENCLNKKQLLDGVKQYLKDLKPNEIFLAELSSIIPVKGKNGNPIFDTLFNFTDFHVLEGTGVELFLQKSKKEMEIESNEMTNTLFDLEVSITMSTFNMQIKYAPGYFHKNEIDTAINLYIKILEEMICAEQEEIHMDTLLSTEEKHKLLYEFNHTVVDYDSFALMHQLFEKQVLFHPDLPALVFKEEKMTYMELNCYANQLGRKLLEEGITTGDFVAVITDRGFHMIAGMLAILKIGAVYIPVDPDYPVDRQEYIMNCANVNGIITDNAEIIRIFSEKIIIRADYDEVKDYSTDNLNIKVSSKELAYIIYTSGSTGNPKGVAIEHTSAVNLIQWVNTNFKVGTEDTLLFLTSMCFDLSVYDIFGMLASGGKIVIAEKSQIRDPHQLKTILTDYKITFWDSVPSTLNYLVEILEADETEYVQEHLRLVFLSGDWIPVQLPAKVKQYFPYCDVISLGGATEAAIWSIYYPIRRVLEFQTSIPYGKPLNNNHFYILDEEKQLLPWGVAGELYIGGVGVAREYFNDIERTNASFFKNPFLKGKEERMYKTGDIGRMLPDGNIEFLGRKDNQVKIRGYRVELGEIENQLSANHKISGAVVIAKTDQEHNKYLCAYIVQNEEIPVAKIKEYLAAKVPEYMIPSRYIYLEQLPLTENGKIDRKSLPEPDGVYEVTESYEPPVTQMEVKIADIWKEILSIERAGIADSFFDLGGHSLKAAALVSKIYKEINVQIPLKQIFATPTIKELAKYIEHAAEGEFLHIKPAGEKTYYKLSSAQKRLFILDMKGDISTGYNMADAMYLYGHIDKEKIERIFNILMQRHESLRTSFHMVNGELVQQIHEPIEFKIDYIKAKEEDAEKLIKGFVRPFDLKKGYLIRVGIISFHDEKHILVYDMHHIISDGFSMQILINEFLQLYKNMDLQQQTIQYKDFAQWQYDEMHKESFKRQEQYWLNKFSGDIPVTTLPADYSNDVKGYRGSSIKFVLDQDKTKQLKQFAANTGTTLHIVLLAVYNVLIAKYSGQEDVIIGTPAAGRNHDDLKNIIGMFVNTLAMRNHPSAEKTFTQFLQEVKVNALDAYENQDYPFEELVSKLGVSYNENQNPLFNVMFVLQNISTEDGIQVEDLIAKPYEQKTQISKFDLTLDIRERKEKLLMRLDYRLDLLKEETVKRISEDYINILDTVLFNPETRLGSIELQSGYKHQKGVISEITFNF